MENKSKDIEKLLSELDFSQGHEAAVWRKVRGRILKKSSLSFDALAAAAGGRQSPEQTGAEMEQAIKIKKNPNGQI